MRFALCLVFGVLLGACGNNGNNGNDGTSLRFGPVASSCTVGERWVGFDIVIVATFERDDYKVTDPIHWSIDCGDGECIGTGTRVWSQRENLIRSFMIQDGRVVSQSGLTAVVQWQDNTFVVNAADGTVTYTGGAGLPLEGYGRAKCDDYGAPRPGIQINSTELKS